MNKYYKSGSFIVEMRKIKGLSQNDLSKKLNVTRKAVSRWENGWGLPDSSLLLPLAQILGVTVDEILMGELSTSKELSAEQIQTIEEMNSFLKYKSEKKRLAQNLTVYIPIAAVSVIGIVAYHSELKEENLLINFGISVPNMYYCIFSVISLEIVVLLFICDMYRFLFAGLKNKCFRRKL